MIGAIIGDILGSANEKEYFLTKRSVGRQMDDLTDLTERHRFTDDTVHTCAIHTVLERIHQSGGQAHLDFQLVEQELKFWTRSHPKCGYGPMFRKWSATAMGIPPEHPSYGNGCIMRISPAHLVQGNNAQRDQIAEILTWPSHRHEHAIVTAQLMLRIMDVMAAPYCTTGDVQDIIGDWYETPIQIPQYDQLTKPVAFDAKAGNTLLAALSAVDVDYLSQSDRPFVEGMNRLLALGGDSDTICAVGGALLQVLCDDDIPDSLIDAVVSHVYDQERQDASEHTPGTRSVSNVLDDMIDRGTTKVYDAKALLG